MIYSDQRIATWNRLNSSEPQPRLCAQIYIMLVIRTASHPDRVQSDQSQSNPTQAPGGMYDFTWYLDSCNPTHLIVKQRSTTIPPLLSFNHEAADRKLRRHSLLSFQLPHLCQWIFKVLYSGIWHNMSFVYMGLEQFEDLCNSSALYRYWTI